MAQMVNADALMAGQPMSVSVFFPFYNEQDNVERVYKDAARVLSGIGIDYEIILVNDGSRDKTREVIDRIAATDGKVKVVHHEVNRGYGGALQSGFRAAAKELVFYTDGDGQFDIGEMPALVKMIGEYDIVSCYRLKRQEGLIRRFNAWCWTRLVCFLFKLRLRDIDCAFKLYRREIFDEIEMHSTGALIDTEILARALQKGYRIGQVGVHHYPRTSGVQTGAKPAVIVRAFRELFKLRGQIMSGGQR